jgi:glycosyltransferase involved in cell wall biosynthesis
LKQAVVERPNITLRVIDEGIFGAQKQEVLEQTHIFILPTQYANEAQPIAVIEAAANGAALIVGNTGEIPEMFSPKALELLATSDAQDIFDKMLPLIENKQYRIQMGLAAYEEALERYSADIFNERWLKLIHENMPNSIHA